MDAIALEVNPENRPRPIFRLSVAAQSHGVMPPVTETTLFAPAKLNLFLAITGRRADGFHDLVSVAVPLDFGDTLRAELRAGTDQWTLSCDDPAVPLDETNLILKAARLFATATGQHTGGHFTLTKRVPMGAGLGGGSSDGVAALKALNTLAGSLLDAIALESLAAQLGSDCALFLRSGPVAMRGRGERVETLPASAANRLSGRRVLVFKPPFGIATAWAYGQMARQPETYLPSTAAEQRLADWLDGDAPAEALLYNNMETVAFAKYLALPTLLGALRERFGLAVRMSGSGSACFALLAEDTPVSAVTGEIRAAWGAESFTIETRVMQMRG